MPQRTRKSRLPEAESSEPILDFARLPGLSMDALRELWAVHVGRATPPRQKQVLIRELAWRVQERLHGGIDPQTQRLLNAAITAARKEVFTRTRRKVAAKPPETAASGRQRGGLSSRDLPTGARLVRTWPVGSDTHHEVIVKEAGKKFLYRGRTYTSLSRVARAITGNHWSGPVFFGLVKRRSRSKATNGVPS